jgi:hypothetical protein
MADATGELDQFTGRDWYKVGTRKMNGLPTVLAIVLPLAGVIAGASLQYVFSRFTEAHKELRRLRSEACVDYLRRVSESPWVPAGDSAAQREFLSGLTEAKIRLSVYGSAEVINALAAFEDEGAKIATSRQKNLFLRIVWAMRKDTAGGRRIPKEQSLDTILMGNRKQQPREAGKPSETPAVNPATAADG